MSMFSAFDVTASGLTAQRLRMDVISEDVAMPILQEPRMAPPIAARSLLSSRRGSSRLSVRCCTM